MKYLASRKVMTLGIDSTSMGPPGRGGHGGAGRLAQLRCLALRNSSANQVPGLEALANSPHLGELLRIDIHNGNGEKEGKARLRQRMGARLSSFGRKLPRAVTIGDIGKLLGED